MEKVIHELRSSVAIINKLIEKMEQGEVSPELMTGPEVQDKLGISRQHLYNLRKAGTIKTYSLGGKNYFLWSQIVEAVLSNDETQSRA